MDKPLLFAHTVYMNARRVLIIGDSLFAETLAQALAEADSIEIAGSAPTPDAAMRLIQESLPDVAIVAEADAQSAISFTKILAAYPGLRVIHADLNTNTMQVIACQNIGAHLSDLTAAINALPKRS